MQALVESHVKPSLCGLVPLSHLALQHLMLTLAQAAANLPLFTLLLSWLTIQMASSLFSALLLPPLSNHGGSSLPALLLSFSSTNRIVIKFPSESILNYFICKTKT